MRTETLLKGGLFSEEIICSKLVPRGENFFLYKLIPTENKQKRKWQLLSRKEPIHFKCIHLRQNSQDTHLQCSVRLFLLFQRQAPICPSCPQVVWVMDGKVIVSWLISVCCIDNSWVAYCWKEIFIKINFVYCWLWYYPCHDNLPDKRWPLPLLLTLILMDLHLCCSAVIMWVPGAIKSKQRCKW